MLKTYGCKNKPFRFSGIVSVRPASPNPSTGPKGNAARTIPAENRKIIYNPSMLFKNNI